MSKFYQNKKTGLNVVNGKIKEVASDGLSATVTVDQWDRNANANKQVDIKVISTVPINQQVGNNLVAAGYQRGMNTIMAEPGMLTNGSSYFETPEIAVVTGKINKAVYRSEEGKMKPDGVTPKSPHFDIHIKAKSKDAEGNDVWKTHIIKNYNNKFNPDAIEKLQKRFEKMGIDENGKPKRDIVATVVTTPGQTNEQFKSEFVQDWKDADGNVMMKDGKPMQTIYAMHMGYKSMDIEFVEEREKTKAAPTAAKEETKAQEAPTNEGSGFNEVSQELDMSDDERSIFS